MANVCTNMFYACSDRTETIDIVVEFLEENFQGNYSLISDDNFIEVEFYSKWRFPDSIFEELIDKLKDDVTLYMRCLSYEFGCEYVSYRVYQEGTWVERL